MNYYFPDKKRIIHLKPFGGYLLLILIISLLTSYSTFGQRNISQQAQTAIDLFDNKEYSETAIGFQKLLQKFPKDPLYQFYLAASLIEMNNSSNQVEDYLKFACAKNTDLRSWYYLGKNYYRQFRFEEAKNAFLELKKRSTWAFNKDYSVSEEIERTDKSKTFFSTAIEVNVYAKKIISEDSIPLVFNILRTKSFQILQKELPAGKSYFFSIIKNWQKGKDIYVSKKINDTLWSEYENLGTVINTPEDEDYPLYDESTSTLYFASKGHGSVGGFDIFRSKYDSVKKVWSTPEQLPYPFNSQWDDFLFVQTNDNVKLVSNRDNLFGKATIYTLEKPNYTTIIKTTTSEEQLAACMLKINKIENKKSDFTKEIVKKQQAETTSYFNEDLFTNISQALDFQKKSDSIINIENTIKQALATTTDKDIKAKLFSELKRVSKVRTDLQNSANEYYAKANTLQFSLPENKRLSKNNFSLKREASDTTAEKGDENQLPDGIIYRIQLGVFSKPVSENLFVSFQPLSTEYMMNGKIIKYYFGFFNQYSQADISLARVKESGFKEAFIIAYYNNKKIPLERAKELEKLQR